MGKRQRQIELRLLQKSDLDEVMEIEPVAFGNHHWSRQSFENELANRLGYYYAAIDAETKQLVGYSGYWLIAGDEAHITTLAVHQDYRRKRIGEVLLINNILTSRQKGAKWLTLEVRVSNEKAQGLYFKFGFKNLGIRRHYYQDNSEDALMLWTENILRPEYLDLLNERIDAAKRLVRVEWMAPEEFESPYARGEEIPAAEQRHV
ncbi:MAG: ribosomal protein S18-alanine N-acetyltransferase [Candidatus Obscuribacterales bacterium]|nr:ribosomal protein S18-alanine N-acetyltransferase [Candidatus Obscuribacterales bacterium]